jgi:hypothetical protein
VLATSLPKGYACFIDLTKTVDYILRRQPSAAGLLLHFAVQTDDPDVLHRLQQLTSPHRTVRRFVPAALSRTWSHARDHGDLRGANALTMDGLLPDANPLPFRRDFDHPHRFLLDLHVQLNPITNAVLDELEAAGQGPICGSPSQRDDSEALELTAGWSQTELCCHIPSHHFDRFHDLLLHLSLQELPASTLPILPAPSLSNTSGIRGLACVL